MAREAEEPRVESRPMTLEAMGRDQPMAWEAMGRDRREKPIVDEEQK